VRRVLIIGVRGHTGRQLASLVAQRGQVPVLGTAREPDSIDVDGVEPLRFEWQDPETWSPALESGAEAVYIARPQIEDAAERIAAFLGKAVDVQRVVLLSEMSAELAAQAAWVTCVEQAVTSADVEWTILRPAYFYQLLVDHRYLLGAIRDKGAIEWPSQGNSNAFIDARDVAAVAADALLDSGHAGASYTLTGPESLTFAEIVARVSRVVGYPVRYIDSPLDKAIEAWATAGVEPWELDYSRDLLSRVIDGHLAAVTDDVERVIGEAPRSLDAFLQECADVWRR
jgi:uncharacterized protein YbjT (DUF2867 family)